MDVVRSPEHLKLTGQVAAESMTLLTNRQRFLPLKREDIHSVAVIGPAGRDEYETGNYYGKPARKATVSAGLQNLLGSAVKVDYEKGAGFIDPRNADDEERAVALAKRSDLVVLCLGTNLRVEAEGR